MSKYIGKLLSDTSWMIHDLVDAGGINNVDEGVMVDRVEKSKQELQDLEISLALYEEENRYLTNRIHKLFDVMGDIQDDEWGMDIVDVVIKRLQSK